MAPPENSPSGSPSISPYRAPLLSEDTPDSLPNRMFTSTIVPSPLLQSVAQAPPVMDNEENLRIRARGLHGQSQLRPHRASVDQLGPGSSDDRIRRVSGSARLRQSLRDNDPRQLSLTERSYGPRIPLWRPGQRQSLYDWAPATPPEDEYESRSLPLPPMIDGGEPHDEMLRDLLRYRADSPPPSAVPGPLTRAYRNLDNDVRMQNSRLLLRSRPPWHGWNWDREHVRERREDLSRSRSERDAEVVLRSRPFRTRDENYRDQSTGPSSSYELEEAIGYLAKLRFSNSSDESLCLAVKAGFFSRGDDWLEIIRDKSMYDDLLLDTQFINVAETSWLKVGGVFWGSQTTPIISAVPPSRPTISSDSSSASLPSNTTAAAISYQDDPHRESGSASSYYSNSSPHHWTVKVIISSIDYAQLRLTGTMEAFTDFQTTGAAAKTSITTYLEGEIIDFKTHSLQTFNFPSSIKDDAGNWRKLEPFCQLSNEELVKSLVSKQFMNNLTNNWVFMRWKEKCFISPQTSPDVGVLTIGGFYFLSLRRSNGQIQGFYYDPKSQPYQELKLRPQKRLFPTYEFR
ncbi:uncharacterized protein LAJ45_08810 [Morchella importuna]|uniref:uncharacterized protein n=1 Tax=Morchella importuna TaxID=1174673 RepID=UPI001E8D99DF|nr:uncharacterized protein LAJ45_08810 [Morchella importuna]KAH8147011.1 hypothetical protein LAJ45_08810 [Morchella importuna]